MGKRAVLLTPPGLPSPTLSPTSLAWQPRRGSQEGRQWAGGPDGCQPRGDRDTGEALTSLQLGHPLQQRVQGALRLLAVSRGLVVEQGLLILQLGHLAQQLPLQLPQPPLEHLPKVTGQRRAGHVHSELVLLVGEEGTQVGEVLRPVKKKL